MDPVNYMASDTAVEMENQSDSSSSGSSLFRTQCAPSLTQRTQRNPMRKFAHLPESVQTDSSSDSSIEPRPLTLKAIFERFKRKKKPKKRKYKPKLTPRGRPKGRRNIRRSQIDKKQIKDKGPRFPILQSEDGRKPLPWRKILSFEQAVARGFFNYIEKLKYEHHLKESLKQMNVSEDLEKEDLDSRRYKYLDDDGSISPIEESELLFEHVAGVEDKSYCVGLCLFKCNILHFLEVCTTMNSLGNEYGFMHVLEKMSARRQADSSIINTPKIQIASRNLEKIPGVLKLSLSNWR